MLKIISIIIASFTLLYLPMDVLSLETLPYFKEIINNYIEASKPNIIIDNKDVTKEVSEDNHLLINVFNDEEITFSIGNYHEGVNLRCHSKMEPYTSLEYDIDRYNERGYIKIYFHNEKYYEKLDDDLSLNEKNNILSKIIRTDLISCTLTD